jgi:hypothetical protein
VLQRNANRGEPFKISNGSEADNCRSARDNVVQLRFGSYANKHSSMTPAQFRRVALSLPEAVEGSHMGHPDFRVGGKIFATLGPDETWAMVKLTPNQQAERVAKHPKAFEPFNGAWGRRGATKVILKSATKASLTTALVAAWKNTAPAKLSSQL